MGKTRSMYQEQGFTFKNATFKQEFDRMTGCDSSTSGMSIDEKNKEEKRVKANEQERRRMKGLNEAMDLLREKLKDPLVNPSNVNTSKMTLNEMSLFKMRSPGKKASKIKTLRSAIWYIQYLRQVLGISNPQSSGHQCHRSQSDQYCPAKYPDPSNSNTVIRNTRH